RSGVPTAATFVFVNMINKLRRDFQPEYFAAVFDVSGSVFRDERARSIGAGRKWNIKTQTFDELDYAGYKANRTEMPPDLAQQLPFIRRSLEAFRIPILQSEGFEADDVIGTLARQAAEKGHDVFVVSNDKDMLQLVTGKVKVLNPVKDNLILDREKVVEVLGVPPEQVIDVMALRGDSIENIPGAPGIGDKGSVELIQQFGSVEAALDRADEVKKKTYRESLQNNRENILLSKELVTIHTGVPIDYSLEAMRPQPPDNAACRELFTELEFTTLLKELAPSVDNTAITYNLKPTSAELAKLLDDARAVNPNTGLPRGLAVFLAEDARAVSEEVAVELDGEAAEVEPQAAENMTLFGVRPDPVSSFAATPTPDAACNLGLAVTEHAGFGASLEQPGLREALADPALPKDVHDLKAVLRALAPHDLILAGARGDVM